MKVPMGQVGRSMEFSPVGFCDLDGVFGEQKYPEATYVNHKTPKKRLGGGFFSDIFWNFHHEHWGKMNPVWRAYVSNGLKPTS